MIFRSNFQNVADSKTKNSTKPNSDGLINCLLQPGLFLGIKMKNNETEAVSLFCCKLHFHSAEKERNER
jgi:hypothetical protein